MILLTKVFLDTNVLMDLLVSERNSVPVNYILTAVSKHLLEAQISTQSIIDAYYSSQKYHVPFSAFRDFVEQIRRYVNFSWIDYRDIDWALENYSGDFEDDAQYACAYQGACDYFITRDKGLLSHNTPQSPLQIISPDDFVAQMF